jgi:hypothetical protein
MDSEQRLFQANEISNNGLIGEESRNSIVK